MGLPVVSLYIMLVNNTLFSPNYEPKSSMVMLCLSCFGPLYVAIAYSACSTILKPTSFFPGEGMLCSAVKYLL